MPFRPFSRQQGWLLPPSLEELVPGNHPARFVAEFVDALTREDWLQLGIDPEGEVLGRPSYHPMALLAAWVYGFMTGVRSARRLEAACRDQLPYFWLTGGQRPDHNTLWRFYHGHRQGMRKLLKGTVVAAVKLGLVDLAVQAVDGTKIAGSAARERTYDHKGLSRLLVRTEAAITELEANNGTGGEPRPPELPERLARAGALRERVRWALGHISGEEGSQINLSDPDAVMVNSRQGTVAGYNAQAVVSPLVEESAGGRGLLITATEVVSESHDHGQAVPMLEAAEATTGQKAGVSLMDAGYHSGGVLEDCEKRGFAVLIAESQDRELGKPYHKDRFEYEEASDSYRCPEGKILLFKGIKRRTDRPEARIYRASVVECRSCPAFGRCTKNKHQGRSLEIGCHEKELRRQRALRATPKGRALYKLRKELVEPVFGILKELHGARRFLLRGLPNVRAEWALLATAFNLKTLFRIWSRGRLGPRWILAGKGYC